MHHEKIVLSLFLLFSVSQAEEENLKVVYDLTSKNINKIKQNILKGIVAHKNYYAGEFKELNVAIVIHGGAYRYFVEDLETTEYKSDTELSAEFHSLKKRLRNLADTYDVEFFMCGVGVKKHKLTDNIVSFVTVLPNSTIGLITKQNEGYAYIPVGD